jgi:predicted acetyltransferase
LNSIDLSVERIDESSNEVIANLFDYYLHDMAEWFLLEVDEHGRYDYDFADHWARGEEVYLARTGGGQLAGFALVGSAQPWLQGADGHDVVEFFVLRRYRHSGIAEALANRIWNMYSGQWLVRVYEGNVPAIPFWRKAIARYSQDRHSEERRIVNGKAWSFFHFKSNAV